MNKQKLTLFLMALVLMTGAALGMQRLKASQRLGAPGIKTSPIPGSPCLNIYLPDSVLDYRSEFVPTDKAALAILPKDTSFMARRYTTRDTNLASRIDALLLNAVLMGTDRTSIHKPQFCLGGSGWNIDGGESSTDTVRVPSPHPYDLPVMKLLTTHDEVLNGQPVKLRGIYVYWFVADHDLTADHWARMRKMATHLLRTGELQRWAYISCFSRCLPGQEAATYERMKKFIAAAVPEFQLATNPPAGGAAPEQTAALVR
jgi:hypothetical protein